VSWRSYRIRWQAESLGADARRQAAERRCDVLERALDALRLESTQRATLQQQLAEQLAAAKGETSRLDGLFSEAEKQRAALLEANGGLSARAEELQARAAEVAARCHALEGDVAQAHGRTAAAQAERQQMSEKLAAEQAERRTAQEYDEKREQELRQVVEEQSARAEASQEKVAELQQQRAAMLEERRRWEGQLASMQMYLGSLASGLPPPHAHFPYDVGGGGAAGACTPGRATTPGSWNRRSPRTPDDSNL